MKKEAPVPAKKFGDVYRHLYFHKVSSRQQLSSSLKISLPTVSANLGMLSDMGLVRSQGEFESTGGRKANMIGVVPEARYAIGIDMTSLRTVFLLTDLCLNVIDRTVLNMKYENSAAYYQALNETIHALLENNHITLDRFLGVGISIPATIEKDTGRVPANTVIGLPVDFADELEKQLLYPFHLINDADAAGWAELWQQDTDQTVVYLSLSYTLGGAIILNRRIYQGDEHRSAEFGHMTLFPHGKKCYCGKKGCVDAYCAEKVLSDFTGGDIRLFFDELKKGNAGFFDIFRQYLNNLAIVINNLKLSFDCHVVLGGTLGYYLRDYLDELCRIACDLSPYHEDPSYIQICQLNDEPSAVGAALYYVDQFIHSL